MMDGKRLTRLGKKKRNYGKLAFHTTGEVIYRSSSVMPYESTVPGSQEVRMMRRRLILPRTFLALSALLPASFWTNQIAEAQSSGFVSKPNVPGDVVYKPVSGSLFGCPCNIGPQSISQGGLGDCYFMSSLAAISMQSPGTIQNAIHYNTANNTYSVTLYKPVSSEPGAALRKVAYTINSDIPTWSYWNSLWSGENSPSGNRAWTEAGNWLNGVITGVKNLSPSEVSSAMKDVPSYATPVKGVLWPALMEKAYAAMLPGGYTTLGSGGNGYDVMRSLTGADGKMWVISHQSTSTVLRSVTVKNVGSVADKRGHGVLAGIFGGKGLTGIEPDLQVCASTVVAAGSTRKCTPICMPGYQCSQKFGQAGFDVGNAPAEIEILDVPGPGQVNIIVKWVQQNPAQCTDQKPCPSPSRASGNQNAPDQPVFVSFTSDQAGYGVDTISTLAAMDEVLTSLAGRPVTSGTLPPCGATVRCVDSSASAIFSPGGVGYCLGKQPCLDTGHEYYLESYQRDPSNLAQGTVKLGNPWGADQVVRLTLENYMHGFITISTNYVRREQVANCQCFR